MNLLAAAAERQPIAIVIDDLQWVDTPSRSVLLFVARRRGAFDAAALGYLAMYAGRRIKPS